MNIESASLVDYLTGSGAACLIAQKYTLVSGENVVRGEVAGIITSGGKAPSARNRRRTPYGLPTPVL